MLPVMLDLSDPRERAFAALVPLAPTVADVLAQVDLRVADDAVRNTVARGVWTPTQRKTSAGYGRFCWAIYALKEGFRIVSNVSYRSSPSQEASNLFLWQVGDFLTLRVKSEPSELVYEATEPLFSRTSTLADETVCLSWEVTLRQTIRDPHFVSVHDRSPWSISLAELLVAQGGSGGPGGSGVPVTPLPPRRPGGPGVSSRREVVRDDDADSTPTD